MVKRCYIVQVKVLSKWFDAANGCFTDIDEISKNKALDYMNLRKKENPDNYYRVILWEESEIAVDTI
jgi:hypothetical protein